MRERKTLFRRVYDSLIEGREREAQRAIAEYLKHRPSSRDGLKRFTPR